MTAGSWLWLLLLPLALALLHVWRHAGRVRPVSSEVPWRDFDERQARGRRLRLPPPSASLLLGLGILTALAVAAADPWIGGGPPPAAVALIVDLSSSMEVATRPGAPRRLDVAREVVRELLASHEHAALRMLVLAGAGTRVHVAGPGDGAALSSALDRATTGVGDPPLDDLVPAVRALVGARGGGRVFVVSDFAGGATIEQPEPGDVPVETVRVGAPADNLAVSGLVVERFPVNDRREAAAIVHNASVGPVDATLEASLDGRRVSRREMRIEAHGSSVWRFETDHAAGQLEVRVSPGGASARDDRRTMELRLRPALRAEAIDELPAALRAAVAILGADGQSPEPSPGNGEIELLYGELPEDLPARWIFVPRASGDSAPAGPRVVLDRSGRSSDVFDPYHPVLVELSAGYLATPPAGLTPIAWIAGQPAIGIVERDGSKGVWWGVSPETTDLDERGLLPLALAAMVDRLSDDSGGSAPPESADLTPLPPPGALSAEELLAGSSDRPVALRPILLALVVLLLLIEGGRRGARVIRSGPGHGAAARLEGGVPSPRAAAGGGRG